MCGTKQAEGLDLQGMSRRISRALLLCRDEDKPWLFNHAPYEAVIEMTLKLKMGANRTPFFFFCKIVNRTETGNSRMHQPVA